MNEKLLLLLREELARIIEAAKILSYSYEICSEIGIQDKYSYQQLDHYEALTSRFARLSDLLIQKIFRIIDQIDLDDEGTVRDRINRAEKKQLIASAEKFFTIRGLRNSIAHEYQPEVLTEIFKHVLELTPELLNSIQRVEQHCQKYFTN